MKRIILMLVVALICTAATAQNNEGRGGSEQMREMIRERMKKELKTTDAQTDSVLNIQQDYMRKSRAIRMNQTMTEDDKKKQMAELEEERSRQMKTVLDEKQLKKVNEFYENRRRMREQRQGSGWQN